jgi:hypothetical protein
MDVLALPFRREAQPDVAGADLAGDLLDLAQMLAFSSPSRAAVSSGAPESSNCPPGSSVMLALPRLSAMMLLPSVTGSQPKRVMPSSMARMPSGPS